MANNSSDFGSVLSSPIESELGSTESDSEQDDDYIAQLTRQMAHSMLQDDGMEFGWFAPINKMVSLRSSQEEVSMLGKFENLKMKEEKFGQEQIMKQKQESLYWGKQANGFNHNEHDKQEARQFHQSKGRACTGSGNGQRVSWANLQQQQRTGSEMTAVFLGESGSRNGSFGTGVFLPRGIGNTCESRKKPGCSTVFIPERVVQSLKLHFDKMGSESRSNGASFPAQHDALTGDVRYGLQFQKKSRSWTVPAKNQEMSLPQEWTY
ncbi:hypothetical protein GH714_035297 [Hevea brasiliensis]|uniref:Uncharacterized protein n=1 Tax=Hevea brasiliensis TaxID=3981 RepID=A0A6A6KSU3_HEVBR|nr:hypothetical protein GH714_035297 [Hevea brasiliensis]